MAALTVTSVSTAGATVSAAAAAGGGDTFANTGSELFYVINGGGSPITVTFATGTYFGGEPITARAVSVNNGVTKIFGPFRPDIFGTTVNVTYSAATSVTVAVFKPVLAT